LDWKGKRMNKIRKISILIPCYNEEKGIGKVIDGIPHAFLKKIGYKAEVIVVDNNSIDKTAEFAKEKGAIVIHEAKIGKGNAMVTGFNSVSTDTDIVVMIDGDNTYKTKELYRVIEPLANNFCDAVVGSRLGGKIKKHSIKFQNRVVNWMFTFMVRQIYRANTTDVLSGYFAWKRKKLMNLTPHLNAEGFGIEMDMITKMKKLGFEIYSVPVTYDQREGESKIDALKDGLMITWVFLKNLTWKPISKQSTAVEAGLQI